jgi:para-aminobenzoate synthetase component I
MIEEAPYRPDMASALATAPMGGLPAAFLSDPFRTAHLNRYSIVSAFPLVRLSAADPDGPILLENGAGEQVLGRFSRFQEAVRAALDILERHGGRPDWPPDHLPFIGGLAGYLSYEFGRHFERMPARPPEETPHVLRFGLYCSVYVADHAEKRGWWVTRNVRDPELRRAAEQSREALKAWLEPAFAASNQEAGPGAPTPSAGDWREGWQASLDDRAYGAAFDRIQRYLRDGDIYQANLTVRYRRECAVDPRAIFRQLMLENPAPFGAFLGSPEHSVLSTSPELLLDLVPDGRIETRPIKGTVEAPPGGEASAAARLQASAKDRAEHIMIVDLERNDLGKVCRTGSVRVDPIMAVEGYTGLQHLVSAVRGQLRTGLGPAEALGALFPGGSISGAPKIRALEIIHELEPVARGIYTGAIGWITPEGGSRMNLAIRTLSQHEGVLDLHVGGGIVADSDMEAEAEECRLKGAAMARAVDAAAQGYCATSTAAPNCFASPRSCC